MYEMYYGKGIKVWSHYMPIHLSQPYLNQGHKAGECPVAENLSEQYVSLPIHPRLTLEALDYLINSIIEITKQ